MDLPRTIDVAILGAVSQEIDALVQKLDACYSLSWKDGTFHLGTLGGRFVLVGTTGLGKVNAAITTSVLLESHSILQVWNIGCAGAYAESPLQVGDVLITQEFLCGDEGILTQTGVLSAKAINIPILVRQGERFYDHFPADQHPGLRALHERTPPGRYQSAEGAPPVQARPGENYPEELSRSFRLIYGPSLTVGMGSGDAQTARSRFQRYKAFAENMEGSAVAQACFRFGTPMIECRGISNEAGNRCKNDWQLQKAVANCHGIILNWLQKC